MCITLFSAPLAGVRAQTTDLFRETAASCHCLCAQKAEVDTFSTAVRTVIVTYFLNHRGQTLFASIGTLVARFDTLMLDWHINFLTSCECDRRGQCYRRDVTRRSEFTSSDLFILLLPATSRSAARFRNSSSVRSSRRVLGFPVHASSGLGSDLLCDVVC